MNLRYKTGISCAVYKSQCANILMMVVVQAGAPGLSMSFKGMKLR